MQPLAHSLNKKHYSNSIVNKQTIVNNYSPNNENQNIDIQTPQLTTAQADSIIGHVSDLINDMKFKHYFYKHLYRLQPTEFLRRADQARKATVRCAGCLFWTLVAK